jgi:DNA-binding transcriptional ArsR family regulator
MNTDAPDVTAGFAGENDGISPALDATLDLLSNRRRRYVLYYLREQGETVALEELAEQVASWESDTGDIVDDERVLADLYHSQLPRLEEADIVTFDPEEGYVTLADCDEKPISEYLDLAAREENVV